MSSAQGRRASALEALANVGIGYGVAVGANLVLLPLFGLPVTGGQAAGIGAGFAGVALVRSYLVRRLFNYISERQKHGGKRQ